MDTDRSREAYELRLGGLDAFEIARELNTTAQEATRLADSWTQQVDSVSADNVEARRKEVATMDLWTKRVDAEYRQENLPIEKAVTAIVRLSERRCKLLGLDAPTKAEIQATLANDSPISVQEEINVLRAELGLTKNA